MNILLLSPFFPYPLTQGGKIRVFNIIKYLSRSHRVTLACLSDTAVADYGPLSDYCEEIICIERKPSTAKDLLAFLLGGNPYNFERYSSSSFRDALRQKLHKKAFDLVQIEFTMMWQYAGLFKGIPVVLDAHNIEYEIIRQIKASSGLSKRLLYILEEKKLRTKEEQAWRECDRCFTVSELERGVIRSYLGGSGKVVGIPNGVDLERFEFLAKPVTQGQVLFLAGMDYIPNIDSAHYFLQEIFPLIRSKMPDVKLEIVGKELWKIHDQPSFKGARFHENAPDVLPWFRSSDLLVVPLRYGAGTRIKILEAMAAGLPVVTTSKGCEGINARHGEHLMIADSPPDFAAAVKTIIENEGLRKSLTWNARRLVEERYSWQGLVNSMQAEFQNLRNQHK